MKMIVGDAIEGNRDLVIEDFDDNLISLSIVNSRPLVRQQIEASMSVHVKELEAVISAFKTLDSLE